MRELAGIAGLFLVLLARLYVLNMDTGSNDRFLGQSVLVWHACLLIRLCLYTGNISHVPTNQNRTH
jgi:hypothetical protein